MWVTMGRTLLISEHLSNSAICACWIYVHLVHVTNWNLLRLVAEGVAPPLLWPWLGRWHCLWALLPHSRNWSLVQTLWVWSLFSPCSRGSPSGAPVSSHIPVWLIPLPPPWTYALGRRPGPRHQATSPLFPPGSIKYIYKRKWVCRA